MCRGSRTVAGIVCRKSHTVARAPGPSLVPSSKEIKRDLSLVFYAWLGPKRLEHNLARGVAPACGYHNCH
jgi:hypothetical protein